MIQYNSNMSEKRLKRHLRFVRRMSVEEAELIDNEKVKRILFNE
jgi:hypothetical protein